jgi:large subunit ribosomal protein L19
MRAQKYTRETINTLGMYKRDFPHFEIGDTIAVSISVKEGSKQRTQVFEGDVIAMHKNGASSTFTVRKIASNSISVERILPYFSPIIEQIVVKRHGEIRRAKLFYLRDRIGKKARVKEKVMTRKQREHRQTTRTGMVMPEPIAPVRKVAEPEVVEASTEQASAE